MFPDDLIVDAWLDRALAEDLGWGDITTAAIVDPDQQGWGIIASKEPGVLAGIELARRVFTRLDPQAEFRECRRDGDKLAAGDCIVQVRARIRALLSGERVALNCLQRLSGIATATARCVQQLEGLPVRIVDTRKTTPGLRALEKYAVRVGGGWNHRFGLHDMVLIKDNHIKAAGGIREAVARVKNKVSPMIKIEVEVETLEQLRETLAAGVDIVMLDNMDCASMAQAVELAAGRVLLEASGGVTEDRLRAIAQTGVNLISIGALTHSVRALDISLDLFQAKPSAGTVQACGLNNPVV